MRRSPEPLPLPRRSPNARRNPSTAPLARRSDPSHAAFYSTKNPSAAIMRRSPEPLPLPRRSPNARRNPSAALTRRSPEPLRSHAAHQTLGGTLAPPSRAARPSLGPPPAPLAPGRRNPSAALRRRSPIARSPSRATRPRSAEPYLAPRMARCPRPLPPEDWVRPRVGMAVHSGRRWRA
ncbi:hypothetical protein GUJ93_ZPchr0001g32557 [Zizania palustris]|uniref:Uncharacterized protein n=1 Tax=Zizania palustris TaxID=103762 RepID=A0A8J5RNZ3_ZIZPA|nr:hypothetical protein GUJ93_ZPchr0001g32557 [Zizania palustris]